MAINTTLGLNDQMSGTLKMINSAIQPVIESLKHARELLGDAPDLAFIDDAISGFDDLADNAEIAADAIDNIPDLDGVADSAKAAADAIEAVENTAGGVPPEVRRAAQETQQFADEAENAKRQWSLMEKIIAGMSIKRLIGMAKNFFSATKSIADNYILKNTQIAQMNDGLQTTEELQGMIMDSARRVRADFELMAGTIAKLNATVGDIFANNASVIQFTETIKQAASISATGAHGIEMSFRAIDRAMAEGALSARDFDLLKIYNVRAIQGMADYLGVTVMEMRNLATQGKLTADVIAGSMLNAVEDINREFAEIPKTWQDMMTGLRNTALQAFSPMMNMWSQFINSESFQQALGFVETAIQGVAWALTFLLQTGIFVFNKLVGIINQAVYFINNNLALMVLIIGAIIIALAVLKGAMIKKAIIAVATAIKTAIAWLVKLWPLGLVVAAIALIIWILEQFGIGADKVLGFVAGLFGGLFAFLWNSFAYTWNIIASFAEFLVNIFIDPIGAVRMLFYNLGSNVLNVFASIVDATGSVGNAIADAFVAGVNVAINAVNWLIRAINLIPGINIGEMSNVAGRAATGQSAGDHLRGLLTRPEVAENYWHAPRMEMKDIMDTAASWSDGAGNLLNGIGNVMGNIGGGGEIGSLDQSMIGLDQDFLNSIQGIDDTLGSGLGPGLGAGNNIGDIGQIRDDVTISDEDLKLMLDMARRDAVIYHTTLSPSVNMTVNSYDGEVDEESLLESLEDLIMDMAATGTA